MRVLLDECIDHRLARELTGHKVSTVAKMGWIGRKNGELLRLAQNSFDAFVTVDRNLSFQQDISDLRIAIIVLSAKTNRLQELIPLVPSVLVNLAKAKPGEVIGVR